MMGALCSGEVLYIGFDSRVIEDAHVTYISTPVLAGYSLIVRHCSMPHDVIQANHILGCISKHIDHKHDDRYHDKVGRQASLYSCEGSRTSPIPAFVVSAIRNSSAARGTTWLWPPCS